MGIAIPQVITPSKATGAQIIDGSLRFDNTKSNYLSRTPGASGNLRTWTWSSWIKRTKFGATGRILRINPSGESGIQFGSDDRLEVYHYADSSYTVRVTPTRVLRDTGWYHIVVAFDSTESTSSDRLKVYINGTQPTVFTYSTYPSQNFESYFNQNSAHSIFGSDLFPAGYVSQVNWIDGAALGPENFGFTDPLTNTWKPKKYTGTFAIASGTPSVSNGGLVIKADGASINGTFVVNGGVKTWTSPDGVTWTRNGSGRSSAAAKYLAVGGAGTALRTFYPDAGSGGFTFYMYNGGGEFDGSSSPFTLDLSSQTYLPSQTSSFGGNGFYLPMDGNSPIGKDQSGNGNDFTPVNFGGSVALDNPQVSGARPILNTTQGGSQAGVGVFGSKQNVGYAVTVYNDGGGNKYYIDGVKQATLTGLIRGATYTFDTTDSSNSGHPFRFSESDGGSEYTNGVAAITGTATTITIPYNSSNELYYYCTNHSGMGSSITGITTNEKLADQYASQCTLALPLLSGDDDVCASIACTANNKTPTNSSVTAAKTQSNFYNGSHYWSANSDTLQYAQQGDELVFGTGDFTIECWVYDDNGHNGGGSGRCYIFDNRIGGSVVGDPPTMVGYVDSHNEFNFYDGDSTITYTVSSTVGKWWHYAVTREGTTTRMFIDGILRGSSTSSTNFTNNGIGVGRATDGGYGWAGYIQDFRAYKGIAKYTSNFVPAATSPDILPDTPSGVSGGSKLTKIAEGAVAFDGTGDYLFAGSSSDYGFGTGDFTIEGYFYFNSTTTSPNNGLWQISTTGGNHLESANSTLSCNLETSGGRTMQLYMGSAGGWRQNGSDYEFKPFMWNHVAEVRSSGVISVYINGKLSQSWSDTTNYNFGDCTVGGYYSTSYLWNGFISNFRVTKSAVYTGNFTPSFTPLTRLSDTKLLCCQSNVEPGAAVDAPSVSHVGGVNDGTQWSAGGAGDDNWDTSNPIENGFDEILSSMARPKNDSVTATWNAPAGGIPFTTLKLRAARDSGSYSNAIKINNVDVTSQFTANTSTLATVTITGVSSPLTKLELTAQSGVAQPRFTAIYIDNVILTDPVNPRGNPRASNFNPFNTDINTVRGQESDYCTLNPLDSKSATITENNLKAQVDSDGSNFVRGTIAVSSGKWYFEFTTAGSNNMMLGALDVQSTGNWGNGDAFYYYGNGGALYGESSGKASSWGGSTLAVGDTLGVALDMDNGTIVFYKNGVLIGTAWTGMTGRTVAPAIGTGGGSGSITRCNFGQKPFKFPPPDGFQPLNTASARPVKVISRPDQYVGVTTYSGNSGDGLSTTQDIDVGLNPDLIWIKHRNGTNSNLLTDTVRGLPNTLISNSTAGTNTNASRIPALIYNGFRVGDRNEVNDVGGNYVTWCWKAGGSKNTFNVDDVGYANASDVNMSVGALNSATYNTSNRWSDDYAGAAVSSGYAITKAFDGDRTTAARVEATQTAMSVDLTSITVADKIEVKGELGYITPYVSVTVGGVTHQIGGDPNTLISGSAGTTSRVITGVSGALTNVTVGRVSSGRTFLSQILVDGKILVDDNITPPNAPSIANIGASVGTKQGFSIIQYQGGGNSVTTVSHGLSQKPQFMIIKNMDDADDWTCYHEGAGETNYLTLNSTAAATDGTMFGDIKPTSTVFYLGAAPGSDYHNRANRSGYDYISYLWHDVPGLQKFGTYEGTGVAGNYVHLGFRPALIWIKNIDSTSINNWGIIDSTRSYANVGNHTLATNLNSAESAFGGGESVFGASNKIDLLSDGFRLQETSGFGNTSGITFLYCAWAEAPSIDLYGGGANAR